VPFLVQKSGYDKQNLRVRMNKNDHAAPGHARQAQERFTAHGAAPSPLQLIDCSSERPSPHRGVIGVVFVKELLGRHTSPLFLRGGKGEERGTRWAGKIRCGENFSRNPCPWISSPLQTSCCNTLQTSRSSATRCSSPYPGHQGRLRGRS
jgi:hypothetical protein